MTVALSYPYISLGQFTGQVIITMPVKSGSDLACDVMVTLNIYEGSLWWSHGTLLARYSQEVHFEPGETKEVEFAHTESATSQPRRDMGVEVAVGGDVVASEEFDDVYTVGGSAADLGGMTGLMGLMMPMMMLGMIMPMVTGMTGTSEE